MKTIKSGSVLLLLMVQLACSQKGELEELSFLIGTWKIEGKESYETWNKKDGKFTGESYKFVNGKEIVTEKLELTIEDDQIIYTPTVFDQNEGKGIPFVLNLSRDSLYSFENMQHDFPKKIQYRILNKNELYVSVLGEKDEGFSYRLIRQPD